MRNKLISYPDLVIDVIKKHLWISKLIVSIFLAILIILLLLRFNLTSSSKDVLRIGKTGNVIYLNPIIQTANENEFDLDSLIYNSLFEPEVNGELLPVLAKTWTITSNGKDYTFFLRDNIYWSDGTKFTADDVITTFLKIKNSKQNTALVKALQDVEITKEADYIIKMQLKQANSTLLELLGIPIVQQKQIAEYSYARLLEDTEIYSPVGTGPYVVDKQDFSHIKFIRNKLNKVQVPKIPNIDVRFYSTQGALTLGYINNEIDVFFSNDPVTYFKLRNYPNTIVDIYNLAFNSRVIYFNMQAKDSPVSNLYFRRALLYGINKENIIKKFPGATVAYGPYPELSWAFNPIVKTYNPDKTKALEEIKLCRTELKDCSNVTLTYAQSDINNKIALDIQSDLKKLQIKLKLNPVSLQELLQEVLPTRDYELLLFGIQTTADPDQYNLWHSSQIKYPGLNIAGLSSKRIDFFLEQGRITTDKLKRADLYNRFQEELFNIVPVIYLYNPPIYVFHRKNLQTSQKRNNLIFSVSDLYKRIYTWEWVN